jgi:hypothetical protein
MSTCKYVIFALKMTNCGWVVSIDSACDETPSLFWDRLLLECVIFSCGVDVERLLVGVIVCLG